MTNACPAPDGDARLATLLAHPDLAALDDWDMGFFAQLADWADRHGTATDPEAIAGRLARFDDEGERKRRVRALRREERKGSR